MGKFRELSPMECTYLASDTPENSPFVNQFIVEGKGDKGEELTLDALQNAVHRAADANPGIKLRLKGRWGYRYWDDKGLYPKVSEQRTKHTNLKDIASRFDGKPINCRYSPCAEVILIKVDTQQSNPVKPSKQSFLVFRVHHAICDGAGCLHWMQEVFRALNSVPLFRSAGRLCEWDVARNYNVQKYALDQHDWVPVKAAQQERQLFQTHWQCLSIEQKVQKPLAKLVYLFAQVAWETSPEGHVCFRIPSDLRRLIDDRDTHLGNLTGAIDIEVKAENTIEDIYQTLLKAKRRNLDLSVFPEHLWIANWLPKQAFIPKANFLKSRYAKGYCNITAIVSQLGKVNLESLSTPSFHARHVFGIPIPIEGVSLSCGMLQNNQGIDICLSAPESLMSPSQLEELSYRIKAALQENACIENPELNSPLLKAN